MRDMKLSVGLLPLVLLCPVCPVISTLLMSLVGFVGCCSRALSKVVCLVLAFLLSIACCAYFVLVLVVFVLILF